MYIEWNKCGNRLARCLNFELIIKLQIIRRSIILPLTKGNIFFEFC